jgi:hypothetical protein
VHRGVTETDEQVRLAGARRTAPAIDANFRPRAQSSACCRRESRPLLFAFRSTSSKRMPYRTMRGTLVGLKSGSIRRPPVAGCLIALPH